MAKQLFLLLVIGAFFSCNNKGKNVAIEPTHNGTFLPPKVTILADLADSLQPKIVDLNTQPKPVVFKVPTRVITANSSTVAGNVKTGALSPLYSKPLPVLLDANGQPLKDSLGNSFIMGDGGVAHFTNFTSEDGLALDAINCTNVDKFGNVWFGTQGSGACRYDGVSFTTFSTPHGLPNNIILDIYEDRKGNLWFGTDGGGASRYDGKEFLNFSKNDGLKSNDVRKITEDKWGGLWFCSGGGAYKLESKIKGSFPSNKAIEGKGKQRPSMISFPATAGDEQQFVTTMLADRRGYVWFGTQQGSIFCFDSAALHSVAPHPIAAFALMKEADQTPVSSIAEDKAGNIWFGTYGTGAYKYLVSQPLPHSGADLAQYTTHNGLTNDTIRRIRTDKSGKLWFTTIGGGVTCYNPSIPLVNAAKASLNFSKQQGLVDNAIVDAVEDKRGNIWLPTKGVGVSRYNGNAFVSFTKDLGLATGSIWSILEDKMGHLWFCSNWGLSRFDGKSFVNFYTEHGLADNDVACAIEDRTGHLWVGSALGGVSRFDGKTFETFSVNQGLVDNGVYCIFEDSKGLLWFGTRGQGVKLLNYNSNLLPNINTNIKQGMVATFTTSQGLAHNRVHCIAEDRFGNLWLGTEGGGVSRYDGKSFMTFSTKQGLANDYVLSITQDKAGNLWFATGEGLSVMRAADVGKLSSADWNTNKDTLQADVQRNQSKKLIHNLFKTFKKADGLPDDVITKVLQLPNGKMAIGTNLGISFFYPTADFTKITDIEIYNHFTGCPIKDVNDGQNSMLVDSKGMLWVGTGNLKIPLVRVNLSEVSKNDKTPPMLIIKGIKINDERICWNIIDKQHQQTSDNDTNPTSIAEEVSTIGRQLTESERNDMGQKFGGIQFKGISPFYPIPEQLELPYEFNGINIMFNSIETGMPKLVNYQYKLEGYDKFWSPVTKNNSATFGNIPEGTYTFKVKAQSPNGVWCEPVTYTFKVLPPWYRTWWAYGSYMLIFVVSLSTFIRLRERKLRLEKAKLEKTVEEKTSELTEKNKEITQLVNEQELIIGERTKELAASNSKLVIANDKLIALIQYNAHQLREPLTRISGAMMIREYMPDEEFFADIWPEIGRAVGDLDNNIKEVIKIADETISSDTKK